MPTKPIAEMNEAELDAYLAANKKTKPIAEMNEAEVDAYLAANKNKQPAAAPGTRNLDDMLHSIPGVGPYLKKVDDFFGPMPNDQQKSDIYRVGLDSATLGLKDLVENQRAKTAAGFGIPEAGPDPDQRKLTEEARTRLGPRAAMGTEFAGGMLTPFGQAKNVGRIGAGIYHAGMGGFQGGLDAYAHGKDWSEVGKEALIGSGASAALSGLGEFYTNWRGRRAAAEKLPSDEKMLDTEKGAYAEVDASGAKYRPNDQLPKLFAEFQNIDLDPVIDKQAVKFRDNLQKKWANRDISPADIEKLRGLIQDRMDTGRGRKQVIAKFKEGMDRFAENVHPTDAAGNADVNVNKFAQLGRMTHANRMKVKDIEKAKEKVTGTNWLTRRLNYGGEGTDLPSRTRFDKLSKKGIGFSKEERAKMAEYAAGDTIRDVGGKARQLSPFRGGLPSLAGVGGLLTAGSGLISPLAHGAAAIGGVAAEGAAQLAKAKQQGLLDEMMALAKTGKALKADPDTVAKYRSLLARIGSSGARAYTGGPK